MKLSFSLTATALALALAACAGPSEGDVTADSVGEINADAPITLKNWLTHPNIVAVRDVVNEVDAAKFVPETKELCADAGHGEFERSKSTDAHLTIRELTLGFGSEDSALTDSYYYDAAGTLRFAFRTHNDVHGNQREYRVYFNAQGERIWEVARFAHSETFNADITKSPYEAPAEPIVLEEKASTPGAIFDLPPRCD